MCRALYNSESLAHFILSDCIWVSLSRQAGSCVWSSLGSIWLRKLVWVQSGNDIMLLSTLVSPEASVAGLILVVNSLNFREIIISKSPTTCFLLPETQKRNFTPMRSKCFILYYVTSNSCTLVLTINKHFYSEKYYFGAPSLTLNVEEMFKKTV